MPGATPCTRGPRIREAAPEDAPAVARLRVRAWRAAYAGLLAVERLAALDAEREAEAWRTYLEAMPAEHRLWVAEEDGVVLGYARTGPCEDVDATPHLGEVHGLYVDPRRIGTGLGRALLERAAHDLAARGYTTLVLWHFVGNDRAARFYERAGLRPDGTVRRSPHGVDEMRLRRTLDDRDRLYTRAVEERLSYEAAGVSLAVAESVVDRLRAAAESTGARGFGAFAGLHPLGDGRFLAASTDGVGSKLVLARRAGRLRWCGEDLAAHCINDVITTGAEPLVLLDYVAANRIDLEQVAELVDGAAAVCREAGCALIGGETAELPGIYREEELDFAGTCVGVVDAGRVVDGSRCAPGDVILGFPSNGIHANGFTLVRRLVGDGDFDADLLLPPTRLYLRDVRALRADADVKALAHVTGGGILGNLPRVLPDGVEARIDWDAWERPPVFAWLADRGVEEEELRRVFNLGIGFCAVVPPEDARDGSVIGELA